MWNRLDTYGSATANGSFSFTGAITGNAMADFLLGKANSLAQTTNNILLYHSPDPSLFLQDDWRLSHRLTLNLGVRWEAHAPWSGPEMGTFVPYQESTVFPSAPIGLVYPGDKGVPNGLIYTSWARFAPRIGFAYDLFGDGKTAIRGAYGIFYNRFSNGNTEADAQPYARSITVSKTPNLVAPFAPSADPFPYTPTPQNAVFLSGATIQDAFPANDHVVPYVEEYNLTLQHEFGSNWSAQVAYVGNAGRRLFDQRDENSPIYVAGGLTTTAGLNARRPYQPTPSTYQFGIIQLNDHEDNSNYNGLQTTLTRRFTRSFSFSGSYVWSKTLGIGTSPDSYDLSMGRGPIAGNPTNRFVASYLWVSPKINYLGFVGKQALSGWRLNGITTLSTGAPYNVTSGVDSNLDGVSTSDRPNQIGNPNISGSRSRAAKISEYINPAAYQQVPAGTPYGNVSYNSQYGPPTINTDLSASKDFAIEKSTLEFRTDAFNLFNYVDLNAPNAILSSPSFGKISGDVSPRILQLALRYSF